MVLMLFISVIVIIVCFGVMVDWFGCCFLFVMLVFFYFVSGFVMLWFFNVYVLFLVCFLDGFGMGLVVMMVFMYMFEIVLFEMWGMLNILF